MIARVRGQGDTPGDTEQQHGQSGHCGDPLLVQVQINVDKREDWRHRQERDPEVRVVE